MDSVQEIYFKIIKHLQPLGERNIDWYKEFNSKLISLIMGLIIGRTIDMKIVNKLVKGMKV